MIQELQGSNRSVLAWNPEEIEQLQRLGFEPSLVASSKQRWSREDYQQLISSGLLEDKHVELLQGEIVVMHPMGSRHYNSVKRCELRLESIFRTGYTIRTQATLDLGEDQPEPDVAIVMGHHDDYVDHHPTTAVLVVEVAETSLATDRQLKASLYASAGIPEFWIVNLIARQVEVHRRPIVATGEPYGHRYGDVQTFTAQEDFAIPSAGARVAVADLLPA